MALVAHALSAHQRGFGVPGLWPALGTSVLSATISTGIIAVFGIPLAFVLSGNRGRLADAIGVLVLLPLALPPLISGILLISIVGPDTWLGRITGGRLTDSLAGVVVAQTFVAAPFLIIAARSAFGAVEPSLDEVAATLGLGRWGRFVRVSLAVAWPGILAGLLLAWLRAFGEFGATVIVAYHPYTIPVFSYVQFGATGVPDTLAPAVLAMGAAAVLVGAATLVTRPSFRPSARRSMPDEPLPRSKLERGATPAPVGFSVERRVGAFHLDITYEARAARLAVLGPSGSGKSTLLRALAGLLVLERDEVHVGPLELGRLTSERRRVGYVPQEASLMPNRTLWRQLLLSPRTSPTVAAFWISRLGLGGLQTRLPAELSGGQRQRAALARALCADPCLLLLDEPLSALDAPVRRELRNELRTLLAETPVSSVLVTHDPEEAALLGDEILVVSGGQVLQAGRRSDVFSRPRSLEVARLLGVRNVAVGRLRPDGRLEAQDVTIGDPGPPERPTPVGTPVLWSIAPEAVRLVPEGLPAVAVDVMDVGTSCEVVVELAEGVRLVARARGPSVPRAGERCSLEFEPGALRAWQPGEFRIS